MSEVFLLLITYREDNPPGGNTGGEYFDSTTGPPSNGYICEANRIELGNESYGMSVYGRTKVRNANVVCEDTADEACLYGHPVLCLFAQNGK